MHGGKNASQVQPPVLDEGPRASGSGIHTSKQHNPASVDNTESQSSNTQPTGPDEQSNLSARTSSLLNAELYQNVLVECNALI